MGYFKTWIDNPTQAITEGKLCTAQEFDQLTARQTGFASGTVISSKEVNSALRQANLVATALMETIAPNYQSGSLESSLNQIKYPMEMYFGQLIGSVTYDDGTHTLTVVHRNGTTETYTIDTSTGTVEAAIKDGAGNVITETYLTKRDAALTYADKVWTQELVNNQASWCDEYDSSYPLLNELTVANWDVDENEIVPNTHTVGDNDNIIISIDKSATKAQCEAFYDALLVPVGQEDGVITVKALGDIPSIDIPVTVMKV